MSTFTAKNVMELRASTGAGMMDCKQALSESNGDLEAARDYLRKKGISIAQKKAGRATDEGAIAVSTSDDQRVGAMVRLSCETDFVSRNDSFTVLLERLCGQCLSQGAEDFLNQSLENSSVQDTLTSSIQALGENINFNEAVRLEASENGLIGSYVHTNKRIGALVLLEGAQSDAARELAKDLAMHVSAFTVHAVSGEELDAEVLDKERNVLEAQFKESGKPENLMEKVVSGRMLKFIKEMALLEQPFVKDSTLSVREALEAASKTSGNPLEVKQFVKFQF